MGTRREEIEKLLKEKEWGVKELAQELKTEARMIEEDLKHVQLSNKHNFIINPAVCIKCGFIFKTRERLEKPSVCPNCKGERIKEPTFRIKTKEKKVDIKKLDLSKIFEK